MPNATTMTVAFLNTLNQIVLEQEDDDHESELLYQIDQ
jgi:hypothetical protein